MLIHNPKTATDSYYITKEPILDIGQLNTLAGKKNLSKPFAQAVSTEIAKRTSPAVVA